MKLKHLFVLWAAAILFTGCSISQSPSADETVPVTSEAACIHETTMVPATEILTEPTMETVPALDISSGAHLRKYVCEDTGDYLDYYLFVPENAREQMPLVIFLHGNGEVGQIDALESYGPVQSIREIYGEDFPFIMISPCTRQYSWTRGTIPDTLLSLILATMKECSIDPEHVIITGHSQGAIGVWYYISEYGDFFSAAVPVSCGSDDILDFENMAKVPVFALVGDVGEYENNYRKAMDRLVSRILEENGTARYVVLNGCGHDDTVTRAYTEEVFNWMLEQ